MTFYVTPKVPVDVKLLKNVVMAGGGQVGSSHEHCSLICNSFARTASDPNTYCADYQREGGAIRDIIPVRRVHLATLVRAGLPYIQSRTDFDRRSEAGNRLG